MRGYVVERCDIGLRIQLQDAAAHVSRGRADVQERKFRILDCFPQEFFQRPVAAPEAIDAREIGEAGSRLIVRQCVENFRLDHASVEAVHSLSG